jgi:hypothetical protein
MDSHEEQALAPLQPAANSCVLQADRGGRLNKMGRFVLIANDAERVQIRAQYSCVIVCFLTSIAVEQLSPDSFPDQTETPRTPILW